MGCENDGIFFEVKEIKRNLEPEFDERSLTSEIFLNAHD